MCQRIRARFEHDAYDSYRAVDAIEPQSFIQLDGISNFANRIFKRRNLLDAGNDFGKLRFVKLEPARERFGHLAGFNKRPRRIEILPVGGKDSVRILSIAAPRSRATHGSSLQSARAPTDPMPLWPSSRLR